jgi:flagellar assembly protein FliH
MMPSSSWRLIRNEPAPPPLPSAAELPLAGAAAVLRGRGRSGLSRPASGGTGFDGGPGTGETPEALTLGEEEIRRIREEAERAGYEAGRRRAESELRVAVEAAGTVAERLAAAAPESTADLAHAITELALAVAKRVVTREVTLDPALLCGAMETAVASINGSPEAHVLLHPLAIAPVRQAWEARHGMAYLGKKWFFEGDPTLPPGGCTVRYAHGFVSAGLEAQLEEIGIALDRAIPTLARAVVEEEVA